jgi:hypothetical protein
MTCVITTAAGRTIELQLNPASVRVENKLDTLDWRSIRGGHFNPVVGPQPERISMPIDAPAKRGSWPGTFITARTSHEVVVGTPGFTELRSVGANSFTSGASANASHTGLDKWHDPLEYLHLLQAIMDQEKGRCFINFPEADIYNWYLLVGLTEDHSGGYGDLPMMASFELDRRIPLLTQEDQSSNVRASSTPPPPIRADPGGQTATTDGTARPSGNYTTRDGDTLQSIAQLAYGDERRYMDIYNANVAIVSTDPTAIVAGMTLRLPP